MSSERHYRPDEKAVEKLKERQKYLKSTNNSTCRKFAKAQIEAFCMETPEKSSVIPMKNFSQDAMWIKFNLEMIADKIEEEVIDSALDKLKEEGIVWVCGRYGYDVTKDRLTDTVAEKLVFLRYAVNTPDYFTDRSSFYSKLEEIQEDLYEFTDSMYDVAWSKIEEDLQEFKVIEEDDLEDDFYTDSTDQPEDTAAPEDEFCRSAF